MMKLLIAVCIFGLAYAALPACRLKPETGLCRGYFPRYYYDPEDGTCKKFIYGGCGGNGNSFETEEECLEECKGAEVKYSPETIATCHLMPETGMCLAYIRRYYYNAQTKRCEEFVYGGCQGNANNFKTLKECEQRCVKPEEQFSEVPICEQPVEPGKCLGFMPRFYYDKEAGRCRNFIYGGCGGNDNNFESFKECEQQCGVAYSESTCQQEKDPGPCRAYFPRYYYDSEDGVCKKFVYGGCRGNDNNFETQEECKLTCESQRSSSEYVCSLEKEVGPCKAYFHRFYFNKDSGKCEGFVYGGCKGNANNFKTLEECERTCPTSSAPVDCTSEPELGFCFGSFKRYFYDKSTQTCKEFYYRGCGGNRNNYQTLEECLKACA